MLQLVYWLLKVILYIVTNCVLIINVADYVDYFKADYDNVSKVTITVSNPLLTDVLNKNAFITLTLSASKNDEVVLAAVVVTLPFTGEVEQPSFSYDVYRGSYIDAESNIIVLDNPISLANTTIDISSVIVTVTPSNTDNLSVTLSPKDSYWEFSIDKLSTDIIDTEIVLVFTIAAEVSEKGLPAEATVIISLPKKISATTIYFEDNVYLADYVRGDNDKIDVHDDIKLMRDTDSSAKISLSDDGKYQVLTLVNW